MESLNITLIGKAILGPDTIVTDEVKRGIDGALSKLSHSIMLEIEVELHRVARANHIRDGHECIEAGTRSLIAQ